MSLRLNSSGLLLIGGSQKGKFRRYFIIYQHQSGFDTLETHLIKKKLDRCIRFDISEFDTFEYIYIYIYIYWLSDTHQAA